ncbi:hypothetical protein BABINDRAFT_58495 [Babjeviella inositovora NRRL Y-12698]|uniref:Vacuolar protein sorting-associated protein 17 n=1 Tax=Babjeviella inositovora NRRL Y-12698 TaxID=984486 RepID=A0A1E3QVW5_9ASCO|nr:uncharacterized protein BABINDRAFT_58495 [Babjeviella inositovora NRRL Y-12698]ODQ81801.1 hypothetical protein BABINDRAFT_58495 [Babjeviella inositovora NRRL Y-12698]
MTSAVPYNPDDFDVNNPLGDDFDNNPLGADFSNNPLGADTPDDTVDVPIDEPAEASTIIPGHTITAIVSDEELHRLLPERFHAQKSQAKITVKISTIDFSKRENPIVTLDFTLEHLPGYRKAAYKDVRRSYAALGKFQKYLEIANLEVFVPSVPPAVTSYPTGEQEQTKVRRDLQNWLDYVTGNPVVIRDDEFVHFIESDFDYTVINAHHKAAVATGLKRKTLKQLQPPYDSFTELAEFRPFVKSVYQTATKLTKQMERIGRLDRLHSVALADFGAAFQPLAEAEAGRARAVSHPGMVRMWQKVAKTLAANADLLLAQSAVELATLGDEFRIVASDAYIVKECLTNRHLVMRELIQAQDSTKSSHTRVVKIKNRSVIDPLKVDEAIKALEFATQIEKNLTLQVKRISGEMIIERGEIMARMETRLNSAVTSYTLAKIETARKTLRNLEQIRGDIRAVDERGGLSRLGRDHLPARGECGAASQSNKGDSWSNRTTRAIDVVKNRSDEQEMEPEEPQGPAFDARSAAALLGSCTF